MGALEILSELGVSVKPRKLLGIYGPTMVGKSVFATITASEWVGREGSVVVFGTEEHYADEDYRKLIEGFLNVKVKYVNYCPTPQDVFKYMRLVAHRRFEGKLALVLDSLSFIAMYEQSKWIAQGYTEPRIYLPRVIPMLYSVTSQFKRLVVEKEALGIVVMHATSTAGAQKYRGITNLRPSMAMRVGHSLDYLLLLNAEETKLTAPRELTLVASRLNPLVEGRKVKFVFKNKTVEKS